MYVDALLPYYLFNVVLLSQLNHGRDFRGASVVFHFLITLSGFIWTIAGIVFLVLLGIRAAWWTPVVYFLTGIVAVGTISALLGGRATDWIISTLGLVLLPLLGWWAFASLPTG